MLNNKNVFKIVLFIWIIIAFFYLSNTKVWERSHDFDGHVQYTETIIKHYKLPKPYDFWQAHHPPLYYLINSFISPDSFKSDKLFHINSVRALSVLYGAIALWLINWFLSKVTENACLKLIVLLFIATTPKFVFVFSTYNNDSLATLLCISILVISYKLYFKWSGTLALILLLVSTAALYTKPATLICIFLMVAILCKNLIKGKLLTSNELRIISLLICSILLFLPWSIFRDYKYSGKLITSSTDGYVKKLDLIKIKSIIGTIFKIPKLQEKQPTYSLEWNDPWAHPAWNFIHPSTKRYDFWGYTFVTSVIGEFLFKTPHVIFTWIILLVHLLFYLVSLSEICRSNITKLSFYIIAFAHSIVIIFLTPYFVFLPNPMPDYRYIFWTCPAWAILYTSYLSHRKKLTYFLLSRAMIVGIILQTYILMTITGHTE